MGGSALHRLHRRREDVAEGLFACPGPPGARTQRAAFLPPQARPDFHLPEWFRPLLPPRPRRRAQPPGVAGEEPRSG